MKNLHTLLFAFAFVAMAFTSCKEEGCTDASATNFMSDAQKDDDSCTYEGSLVFWFDDAFATFMENFGATEFRFYLNDDWVGTASTEDFVSAQPTCGDAGVVTVTQDLGRNKNVNFQYSVEDQNGDLVDAGLMAISANGCRAKRIN